MKLKAFTLAELLIALLILGVIATFTIPKVLTAQANGQYKAMAKEVMAMMTGAYSSYIMDNVPTAATRMSDFTPYMNYVARVTVGSIDGHEFEGSINCASTSCYKLHNGGIVRFPNSVSFSGTANTNAVYVNFDPDGTLNANHSLQIWMYFNGRITTVGSTTPNTVSSSYTQVNPCPTCDPAWFSWN